MILCLEIATYGSDLSNPRCSTTCKIAKIKSSEPSMQPEVFSSAGQTRTKIRVLFVCLGNICRSPLAESVFQKLVNARNLHELVEVDSAGTGSWHVGALPDPRARNVAERHHAPTTHRARQIISKDFQTFDHIVALDNSVKDSLLRWNGTDPTRISLMMDWVPDQVGEDVPDPYYGELNDFELVYEMVLPACEKLLDECERTVRIIA